MPPYLSLVLPAFNEAAAIGQTISEIVAWLEARELTYEIIVAADGSDGTREVVREMARTNPRLRAIGHPERLGKGRGVREAVALAEGEIIGYADAGVATPVATVEPYLELCDQVLVMAVMPGFGGQEFDPVALDKLRRLRAVAPPRLLLSVDGGVNEQTIGPCARAGAHMLVAGTAFFGYEDYARRLAELTSLANASQEM